jgi:hypothetical protein
MKTRIIPRDELGITDDAYGDITLDDFLFNGVAFERNEDGLLLLLVGFKSGKHHGPTRYWYPSGHIESEHYFYLGGLQGPVREWYESGQPKRNDYVEYGYSLRRRNWNADGTPAAPLAYTPTKETLDSIAKRRRQYSAPIIDIDLTSWEFVQKPVGWGLDPSELATVEQLEQAARNPRV